jgi:hypothetical protein
MIIGSYSETASVWWSHVREQAQDTYDEWLASDPMERTVVLAEEVPWHRYSQLAIRVATALLDAVPEDLQREFVSTRQTSATVILFRLMIIYQPGGQEERNKVLSELRKAKACSTAKQAVDELRTWLRRMNRARELKLSLPDPSEQWASITTITDGLVAQNLALQWRVLEARNKLRVDQLPTAESVMKMHGLLLAEFSELALQHGDPKTKAKALGTTTAAAVDAKGGGKGGKGSKSAPAVADGAAKVLCRFYPSDKGCKAGGECTFPHDQKLITRDHCRICGRGDGDHWSDKCPAPRAKVWPRPQDKGLQGASQPKGGGKGGKGGSTGSGTGSNQAATTPNQTPNQTPTKAQVKKAAAEAPEAEAVAQKAKEEKAQAKAKAKQAKAEAKAAVAATATASAASSAPAPAQVMTRDEIKAYLKRVAMLQAAKCIVVPESVIRMKSLSLRDAEEANRQVLEQVQTTPQPESVVTLEVGGG